MTQPRNSGGKEYAKWSGVAMQGIVAIVGFTLLGHYADKYFNFQKPLLVIIGISLGTVLFFYVFFKAVFDNKK